MSNGKKQQGGKQPIKEGYRPFRKGYRPTQGNVDSSNPPQGGSGVPAKPSKNSGKTAKK
jgi:hypothetical protein